MKRAELSKELETVRKWVSDDSYPKDARSNAEAAERRILNWYDEISRELEYTGSLRLNLKTVVAEKVELEIEVQELQQKLEHALRTRKEAGETDDD